MLGVGFTRGYISNLGSDRPGEHHALQLHLVTSAVKIHPVYGAAQVGRPYYLGTVQIRELRRGRSYPNASNIRPDRSPD